ncbi:hypothetical protein [Thalassospira xiamenensis]|uniref:hypothetical protein n=1 Tax=Thalassospira xiamenensis TaxID=220697 RepID=UPI003AA9553E
MSISGGGSWGGSDALSGGGNDNGGSDSRNKNVRGGKAFNDTRGGGSAPSGNQNGGDGRSSQPNNRSLGSMRAELDRRDRAAVAALSGPFGGVNVASKAFNEEEAGFGDYFNDFFGVDNPGGFLQSSAFKGLTLGASLLTGGLLGAGIGAAGAVASSPRPDKNIIGIGSRIGAGIAGAFPGVGPALASLGLTGVGLVDEYGVDLDKVAMSLPESNKSAVAASQVSSGLSGGLYQGSGGNGSVPPTALASARTGNPATPAVTKPKPNPNTIRRTFGPLNLRYAQLRGIEDLI